MAQAMVTKIDDVQPNGNDLTLVFTAIFYGTGVQGFDLAPLSFSLAASDTLNQIRSKWVAAITAEGTRLGYSLAVSAIVLPSFQRGG